MTKFQAEIDVMPKKEILDPQGKAVTGSMKNLGLEPRYKMSRIGKHISLWKLRPTAKTAACSKVELACKNLLANLIMESYSFKLAQI